MRKQLLFLLLLCVLAGCEISDEVKALEANNAPAKVWVFIQFNVPEEGDQLETYYYYAKVSRSLIDKISNNSLASGFIFLEDARYWGNDDLIHTLRNVENTGDLVFRIEDIARVKLVRTEPRVGLGYEQFEDQEAAAETTEPEEGAPSEASPPREALP